ncbi:MAG: GspE/PulE family protein [Planctomycetota bacterium]
MSLDRLRQLDPQDREYASRFVELLLAEAGGANVSDIHVQPLREGLEIAWRIDGVLLPIGVFPRGHLSDVVARLKVLANLLTYRSDIPQEGRLRESPTNCEMRLSTFPTLHGERAVIRTTTVTRHRLQLNQLSLPINQLLALQQLLAVTSGALIITGPAGSGKTTTAYACLRELNLHPESRRCIISIEDPIESELPGVAQSQVNPVAGFDLSTGLKSILRQDPEVIFVGEIRDRATAEGVLTAALTGHLVITTFHAGSPAEAINRLGEMGLEHYQVRGAINAIISQRLVRRLCDCAAPIAPASTVRTSTGCQQCRGSGYRGRILMAEIHNPKTMDSQSPTLVDQARAAVQAGLTSEKEIIRVLGYNIMK